MHSELEFGQVGPRAPFCAPEAEAILQQTYSYWHELRRGGSIPLRQDIAPARLDDALPHAFVAQRMAPGIARMRVAGQALRDLIKMDGRGMPLSTFLLPETREALMPLVEAAFQDPAIVEIALQSPRGLGRPAIEARLLLLPLRDEFQATSRVFGVLVTNGLPGLRRRQFALGNDPVVRMEKVTAQSRKIRLVAQADDQRLDAPVSILPNPPQALRLVVNNT